MKKVIIPLFLLFPTLVVTGCNKQNNSTTSSETETTEITLNKTALSLYEDDKLLKSEKGEIQLTDYGVSGIVTFNVSGIASKLLRNGSNIHVKIDFMPEIKDLKEFINKRSNGNTLESIFESIFNYKLLFALLKASYLERDDIWDELTDVEQEVKNKYL